ncbi:hypothetical protein DPSP01_009271 [Paraphaeosphaeria sporulosa]
MVYNWGDKEAECYQLYVRERRSLREVAAYWKQRGFTPSKRAFQTQFKVCEILLRNMLVDFVGFVSPRSMHVQSLI